MCIAAMTLAVHIKPLQSLLSQQFNAHVWEYSSEPYLHLQVVSLISLLVQRPERGDKIKHKDPSANHTYTFQTSQVTFGKLLLMCASYVNQDECMGIGAYAAVTLTYDQASLALR